MREIIETLLSAQFWLYGGALFLVGVWLVWSANNDINRRNEDDDYE